MTLTEAKKLPCGLYRVMWEDGRLSLASVGRNSRGIPWLAPTNWVTVLTDDDKAGSVWELVKRMQVLSINKDGTETKRKNNMLSLSGARDKAFEINQNLNLKDSRFGHNLLIVTEDGSKLDLSNSFYEEEDNWYLIFSEHFDPIVLEKDFVKLINEYE